MQLAAAQQLAVGKDRTAAEKDQVIEAQAYALRALEAAPNTTTPPPPTASVVEEPQASTPVPRSSPHGEVVFSGCSASERLQGRQLRALVLITGMPKENYD